jgi:hypothetical protein
MEKIVLVCYCDGKFPPQGYVVEANPREIETLKEADGKWEHQAWETPDTKSCHIAVLHYLRKAKLYKNEKEFDQVKQGWIEDGDWEQENLDMIKWSNYGKWDLDENAGVDGVCMGTWYFYHILVNGDGK